MFAVFLGIFLVEMMSVFLFCLRGLHLPPNTFLLVASMPKKDVCISFSECQFPVFERAQRKGAGKTKFHKQDFFFEYILPSKLQPPIFSQHLPRISTKLPKTPPSTINPSNCSKRFVPKSSKPYMSKTPSGAPAAPGALGAGPAGPSASSASACWKSRR